MNSLDILLARLKVNKVKDKIALSLSEIVSKNPNRYDLIESMDESKKDLEIASITFFELEREYSQSRMYAGTLVTENLKMLKRIEELEEIIKNNKEYEDELVKLSNENELLKKRLNSML